MSSTEPLLEEMYARTHARMHALTHACFPPHSHPSSSLLSATVGRAFTWGKQPRAIYYERAPLTPLTSMGFTIMVSAESSQKRSGSFGSVEAAEGPPVPETRR